MPPQWIGLTSAPLILVVLVTLKWKNLQIQVATDWDTTYEKLLRFAILLHRFSKHPDLVDEIVIASTLSREELRRALLKDTPVSVVRYMDVDPQFRADGLRILVRYAVTTFLLALKYRVLIPIDDVVARLRVLDTSADGRWRAFGSTLHGVGIFGFIVGLLLCPPLASVFAVIVALGFALHAAGFARASQNALSTLSRFVAAIAATVGSVLVIVGPGVVGSIFLGVLLASGTLGILEYSVDPDARRRIVGTVGSSIIVSGSILALGGASIPRAGVLIVMGVMLNLSTSILRHLRELRD